MGVRDMGVSDLIKNPKALFAQMKDFLDSKELGEDARSHLSYANGLMTAVIVSPAIVSPAEWMPLVSSPTGQCERLEDAQLFANFTMLHYYSILRSLNGHDEPYQPLFWEDENKRIVTRDWAAGFLHGMRLRREAWEPFLGDTYMEMMAIVAILSQKDEARAKAVESGIDFDEAFDDVCKGAPQLIRLLYDKSVASAREAESRAIKRAEQKKIGRNDPCPCGSGKKHKKCCLGRSH